jgi:hypothetical protein
MARLYMVSLWTASFNEAPAANMEDDDDLLADCADVRFQPIGARGGAAGGCIAPAPASDAWRKLNDRSGQKIPTRFPARQG